jgi:deoxycytidylate deaminase
MFALPPLCGDNKIPAKTCNERQEYYMMCAAKVAHNCVMEHKHGAVIVFENTIISSGFNIVTSIYNNKMFLHFRM